MGHVAVYPWPFLSPCKIALQDKDTFANPETGKDALYTPNFFSATASGHSHF